MVCGEEVDYVEYSKYHLCNNRTIVPTLGSREARTVKRKFARLSSVQNFFSKRIERGVPDEHCRTHEDDGTSFLQPAVRGIMRTFSHSNI